MHAQRTCKEYTVFCHALADAYPQVLKIRLVQDNLNTHTPAAFYTQLPADQAFALARHFYNIHQGCRGSALFNFPMFVTVNFVLRGYSGALSRGFHSGCHRSCAGATDQLKRADGVR